MVSLFHRATINEQARTLMLPSKKYGQHAAYQHCPQAAALTM